MRTPIAKLTLSLLVLVGVGTSPVGASGSSPPVPNTAPEWARVRERAIGRMEAARAQLAAGGIAATVRAAAGLGAVDASLRAVSPEPVPASVSAALAESVGQLLGAVEAAGAMARRSLRDDPAAIERAFLEMTRAISEVDMGRNEAAARTLRELDARFRDAVDRELLFSAALTLASVIDRELPRLRAAAVNAPAGASGAGCDVAQVQDLLCIGGTGANTHEQDFALLIDLGGDDVHANAAGAADVGVLGGGNGNPAAVAIDVGGDDRYVSAVPAASGARAVQGSGYLGGVGFLVDASGDDLYSATAKQPPVATSEVLLYGQGVGAAGAGVLADLAGDDTYRLSNRTAADPSPYVYGQSLSGVGGLSILQDSGGSNDDYRVENAPGAWTDANGRLVVPGPFVQAFGYAVTAAVALWADDGGSDTASADALAPTVPPDERREIVRGGPVSAGGMGLAALGGAALVTTGAGSTEWSLVARSAGPTSLPVSAGGGLAEAVFGGYAGLHDAGGDDVYRAEAVTEARAEASVDDACGCAAGTAEAKGAPASASVLGGGGAGGVGIVVDAGGDDEYSVYTSSTAIAEVRDERTVRVPFLAFDGALASATAGAATSNGQGLGVIGGAGFLHDLQPGGSNRYVSEAITEAHADASDFAQYDGVEGHAVAGDPFSGIQAIGAVAGYGELRDSASSTTYSSKARSAATAAPETEVQPGVAGNSSQGSVELGGAALLLDLGRAGQTNSFATVPEDRACQGTRGEGVWVDCGVGGGLGAAASAPVAAEPSVESDVFNVSSVWQQEPPPAPGLPAPRKYPLMIAYDGRLTAHADGFTLFDRDAWGETHTLRLADLSPDAAPDAITSWALRGRASPIKIQLLNDLGVDFRVAELAPFGTAAQFGQGAVHDLYFYAGAPAGSQAAEGNVNEALVINGGMPVVFPDRSRSGTEGTLAWDMATTLRSPTSTAYDPVEDSFYSTSLVSAIATPYLKVEGGDLTAAAEAEDFSLVLPEDVRPFGALAIYPSGMPGVHTDLSLRYPGQAQRDFHELVVGASADPVEYWPESRSSGPLREWMWRPLIVQYGTKRSSGAGAAVTFEAPLPAGAEALALSVDGTVRRIGANHGPGIVQVLNVEGKQQVRFIPQAPTPPAASGLAPDALASPTASAGGLGGAGVVAGEDAAVAGSVSGAGGEIRSPQVRHLLPEGVVSASFGERSEVPTVADLLIADRPYGDSAVPHLVVDGRRVPVTAQTLAAPPQVTPIGFSDGGAFFFGAGFFLQLLVRTEEVMIELAWQPLTTNFWSVGYLYVLDVHSVDGESHAVGVDWYSGPAADGFAANGVPLPVETVTHEEFNGDLVVENRPDIVAVNGQTGRNLRYFLLTPAFFWQLEPEGLHGLWALIRETDGYASDPFAEVDGEPLTGDVALYARMRFEGFGEEGLPFQGSLFLMPA